MKEVPTMRIACLLDSGYEDSEFRKPYDAFRQAGHDVVIIGKHGGAEVAGKRGQDKVKTDKGIAEASADDVDALFIPGGYSPDHLRIDDRVVRFTRAFFERERPVFAVCHGPQLLITAEVVKGRRMTAWPTIQEDLRKLGAEVVDQEVVVDGQLITSRKPDDLDAFIRESLAMLQRMPAGRGA
jgi:protease I